LGDDQRFRSAGVTMGKEMSKVSKVSQELHKTAIMMLEPILFFVIDEGSTVAERELYDVLSPHRLEYVRCRIRVNWEGSKRLHRRIRRLVNLIIENG
jgi:hypothetical protein